MEGFEKIPKVFKSLKKQHHLKVWKKYFDYFLHVVEMNKTFCKNLFSSGNIYNNTARNIFTYSVKMTCLLMNNQMLLNWTSCQEYCRYKVIFWTLMSTYVHRYRWWPCLNIWMPYMSWKDKKRPNNNWRDPILVKTLAYSMRHQDW
jgi:hypothetical protein